MFYSVSPKFCIAWAIFDILITFRVIMFVISLEEFISTFGKTKFAMNPKLREENNAIFTKFLLIKVYNMATS